MILVCKGCGLEKYESLFQKDIRLKSGFKSKCRCCMNIYQNEYNAKNRQKRREYSREWYLEHRESELERHRVYKEKNAEAIRERSRLAMQKRREQDPEGALAYTRNYRKNNPEKAATWDMNKRHKRRAAMTGSKSIKRKEWDELKEKYNHSCVYCSKKCKRLTMDHVTPLSNGGLHEIGNIVPACISCNASKHANDVIDWTQKKLGKLI